MYELFHRCAWSTYLKLQKTFPKLVTLKITNKITFKIIKIQISIIGDLP